MQQKYYTIAFADKTQNGSLANAQIKSGTDSVVGDDKKSDKSVVETITGQLGNKLMGTMVGQASTAVGFNLSPAFNMGKALMTGATGGAIASAGIAIAGQVASLIYNAISTKLAELKQEASEANERDNVLILAGSLDVSGYTIKKGKYGRDLYVYNRN